MKFRFARHRGAGDRGGFRVDQTIDQKLDAVQRYLPAGYRAFTPDGSDVWIGGVDIAGWTLDDYVIPRLSTGLYPFFECEPENLVRLTIKARNDVHAEQAVAYFGLKLATHAFPVPELPGGRTRYFQCVVLRDDDRIPLWFAEPTKEFGSVTERRLRSWN